MMQQIPASTMILAAAMIIAGFVFSLGYFHVMQQSVARFAAGRGWGVPAALTLGRLIAVTLFLAAAAKLGAAALIAAFAGFLAARAISLHKAKRAR